MRKLSLLITLIACGAFVVLLNACKARDGAESLRAGATPAVADATPPKAAAHADGVRRVTVSELRKALEQGEAVVVDVRGKAQYDGGHIKGAVSLPREELAARVGELPKDKLLVFYCA